MSRRSTTRLSAIALAALLAACAPLSSPPGSGSPASPSTAPTGRAETPSPAATATVQTSASPSGTPVPAPTPSSSPASGLIDALGLLGNAGGTIAFTDWVALRRATGSAAVSGASDFEAKMNAIGTEVPSSNAWLTSLKVHRADWGFDAFDLAWEAAGTSGDGVLHVLRFADPSVPLAFLARLDALGYTREVLPHGILRQGLLSDLLGRVTPSLALQNAGVLDDGLTVVASVNADLARAVLSSGPLPPASDAAVGAAGLVGTPVSAILLGNDPCTAITSAARTTTHTGDGPSVAEQLAEVAPLGHPAIVAVTYSHGDAVTGRVVMTYDDAARAAADLGGRALLARGGRGFRGPLAEVQAVTGARVDGSSIVLDLAPPAGGTATKAFARRLMGAATTRDLIYAACTP